MKVKSTLALSILCLAALTACGNKDATDISSASVSEVFSSEISSAPLDESNSFSESTQTGTTVFEENFTAEFKDSSFNFSFLYPKELEIATSEGQISLSSADPIVVLQINTIIGGGVAFDEYKAELQDTFSDIKEFKVDDKNAAKGIQNVGQGAKINYAIDAGDDSIILIQGVVDGIGSEDFIPVLDKIVEGFNIQS